MINTPLNILVPPATLAFLIFFLPPYYLLKSLLSAARSVLTRQENVAGKVVLITGASSGIGEHIAYEYARRGARLALVARRARRLEAVAATAGRLGSPDVVSIPADVTALHDTQRFVEDTVSHFGRLDHLVVNAGITPVFMFEEVRDISTLTPAMETNFWGAVYSTYCALPHLRNSMGRIVVVASSAGWLSSPRLAMYSASKAAVLSFFEALRIEVGREIGITIVAPGLTESEVTKGKFLSREGEMIVDQDMRDVQVSVLPVQPVEGCAKAIVRSACRGDKNLVVPSWMRQTILWKTYLPEILDWINHLLLLTKPGISAKEAAGKKILDFSGAERFLYPASIRSPDLDVD